MKSRENPYRAAGTFTGVSYIKRQADSELYEVILRNRRYPYLSAPRQSGKSSLLESTVRRLPTEEYLSIFIDLSEIPEASGNDFSAFLRTLSSNIATKVSSYIDSNQQVYDLDGILENLIRSNEHQVIIILDEVDVLMGSDFRESFFSKIRAAFNKRASEGGSHFTKVQFVLSGAALPRQLISEPYRSPFNVGNEIVLSDFSMKEVKSITLFLQDDEIQVNSDVSSRIYYHTNGMVYLTQLVLENLWEFVQKHSFTVVNSNMVDTVINTIIEESPTNIHFDYVVNQILLRQDLHLAILDILADRRSVVDKEQFDELRIIGIISDKPIYRNKIYERVFGHSGPLSLHQGAYRYFADVRNALEHWNNIGIVESSLNSFYLFRSKNSYGDVMPSEVANQIMSDAIDELRHRHLHIANFLDSYLTKRKLVGEVDNDEERYSVFLLAKVLYSKEVIARKVLREKLLGRLDPPSFVELLGTKRHVKRIHDALSSPDSPWIFSLEGLGGIGKTSLADAVMREAVNNDSFEEIAWIKASPNSITDDEGGPALAGKDFIDSLANILIPHVFRYADDVYTILRKRLKEIPHLITIDNLETDIDLECLLPLLHDLANPTKFLLTSRARTYGYPNLFHFPIPELSEEEAFQVIRLAAKDLNLTMIVESSDDVLRSIYETVGGNPLALRLIIGQMHTNGLDLTLEDMRLARGVSVERLYDHIYSHVWENLDDVCRRVLLSMCVTHPGGEGFDIIVGINAIDKSGIRIALDELIQASLIEARGISDKSYSIHQLTRTFLSTQVLKRSQTKLAGRFQQMLVRMAIIARTRIESEEKYSRISNEARDRALNVLSYLLEIPETWIEGYNLLMTMAQKMEMAGYRESWIQYLEKGVNQIGIERGDFREGTLCLEIGKLYRLMSDFETAESWLNESIKKFQKVRSKREHGYALALLATLRVQRVKYNDAERLIMVAMDLLENYTEEQAYCYFVLGNINSHKDKWVEAENNYKKSIKLWKHNDDKRRLAWGLRNLGVAVNRQKKFEEAAEFYNEAIALYTQNVDDPLGEALTQMNLGITYANQGEYNDALEEYIEAEKIFRALQNDLNLARVYNNMGIAYRSISQYTNAKSVFENSIRIWERLNNIRALVNTMYELGTTLMEQKGTTESVSMFQHALTLLDQTKHEDGYSEQKKLIQERLNILR
ncbi:MAG: tetratricopeptide repeat protein [Chloroflexota bacterium]